MFTLSGNNNKRLILHSDFVALFYPKKTLASARVVNHVHSVTFLHRYMVSVDNKFRKTYLLWKCGQSISTETVMQFTEEHVNKIVYRNLVYFSMFFHIKKKWNAALYDLIDDVRALVSKACTSSRTSAL